ncbi:MAG: type II secretion system F family protein [Anaerolineae bacterium]|nr:type II secretion system F family protein [Anaerolineae bacterium]
MAPQQLIGIIIMIGAGVSILGGLIYVGFRDNANQDPLQARLAEYGDRELPASLEDLELSLSFRDRVLVPMFKMLANMVTKFTPEQQIESTRKQLELAGKAQTTDARTFFGTRIMLTVLLGGGAFFLFFFVSKQTPLNAILLTVGGAALGYFLPALQLRGQISRRQNNIVKALPDALDLLTICVEAGLGFDSAMGKVYEKWDNELSQAFGRVLQEIQLGKMRRESLRDMAARMEVPDVTSFTAAIIQADQLGVSISKILRIQADQMRVKRRQRAQEKAQQAPVKMLIPMVFLIFPSIWIVLLGPAIILLRQNMSGRNI